MTPRLALCVPGPSRLLRPRSRSSIRYASSQSQKICAAPFRISPADALHKLQMNGLVASANFANMIYAGLLRFFGPGIGTFAKEFGLGESLQLRSLKAVYWPVWRFDLILEGPFENGQGKTARGSIGIAEGYLPGNAFAPLSYLSYSVPPLSHDLPVYDPDKDLKQLGEGYDVVPVPFSVSPFAVGERIRRSLGKKVNFQGARIDEAKWKEKMFACYPIMFPIYVADFEFKSETRGRRFAVVLDAHDEDGFVATSKGNGRIETIHKELLYQPRPFPPIYTNVNLNDIYSNWVSPPPTSASSIPPSPLLDIEGEIPWDDVRIQSWSGQEFEENNEYFDKAMETLKGIGALESIADLSSQLPKGADPPGVIVSNESDFKPRPMSEIKDQLSEDVDRLKKELEEVKPKWLREYDETKALPERLQVERKPKK